MTTPIRILLADDCPDIRAFVTAALEHEGYQVVPVSDGLEALCMVLERAFDVLVTDYDMPWLNGLQLLVASRRLRPDKPVIVLSALPDVAPRAMELGACACLLKPWEMRALIAAIRLAVHHPEPGSGEDPWLVPRSLDED